MIEGTYTNATDATLAFYAFLLLLLIIALLWVRRSTNRHYGGDVVRIKRVWQWDPDHVQVIEGQALAWSIDKDGVGHVTIRKDDGSVVTITHSVNTPGEVTTEVRFL